MPTHPRLERRHLLGCSTAPLAKVDLGFEPSLAQHMPGELVTVAGRQVMVRRIGQFDPSRPVAVYLHGLAGASTNFNRLAPMLTGEAPGLAIDLLGSGYSQPSRRRYSLDADVRMVAAVIAQRVPGSGIHLVGSSLGGVVATRLAASLADRLISLTLLAPAVPDMRLTADRGADIRLGLLMLPGTTGYALSQLAAVSAADRTSGTMAACFAHPERVTEAELAVAVEEQVRRDQLPWANRCVIDQVRALIRSYFGVLRRSFWQQARRVEVPVLVVWGIQDRLVDPALAPKTAAAFPDARLLIVDNCGHLPHMEAATATARAIVALWRRSWKPDTTVPVSGGAGLVSSD